MGNIKYKVLKERSEVIAATETITIEALAGMSKNPKSVNAQADLTRNALSLYPYIRNQTISHGKAAEILGIRKAKLIDIYDRLGYSYLDMTMDGLDLELETFRQLKKRR